MLSEKVQEDKENGVVTEMKSGICPCCRQAIAIEATLDLSEEQLNELAEEFCNCSSAQFRTQRKKRVEKIEEKVNLIFGETGSEPIEPDAVSVIIEVAKQVAYSNIGKVTINLDNNEKAKILLNKDDRLVIIREAKTQRGEMA